MIAHDQMLDLVDIYAVGALAGEELAEFEAHLERCVLCQGQLDLALSVTASLIPDSIPPNEVWPRIVAEIAGRPTVSP